jgi:hypothetical protein
LDLHVPEHAKDSLEVYFSNVRIDLEALAKSVSEISGLFQGQQNKCDQGRFRYKM